MSLAVNLKDYRLTTAEILYHLPDHPGILQSYVWQDHGHRAALSGAAQIS